MAQTHIKITTYENKLSKEKLKYKKLILLSKMKKKT